MMLNITAVLVGPTYHPRDGFTDTTHIMAMPAASRFGYLVLAV